ncbi:MAG: hypothetical protein BroJett011_05280 [Chloroflexota bacterium]|nr:MAG: hypothetical protein BroJett011_05280 [Chloroflexota bacterium]
MVKSMSFASRLIHHVSRAAAHPLLRRLDAGLILAGLLTLFIIQSLLRPGLPTQADLPIHLFRTLEYSQAWGPGVIVPRWAPNLAYGYGYPMFVFAPPLPYWLGLAFHSLGLSWENAFKLLIILTILLYAIGMYLLGRDVWGSVEAGLVAATAFAFAPFALREALLYGGNVPQLLAIGLFPWTLWAMTWAARKRSWSWGVLAAFFYAGVLLSHLFQVLIFTPVVGLYGFILLLWAEDRGQGSGVRDQKPVANSQNSTRHSSFAIRHSPFAILYPLSSIPLGLLLTAFFWLPAFTERVFTRAQADIYLEKSPFYVRYPQWTELVAWIQPLDARAANPYAPLSLGVITLILAALGLAAGIIRGQGSGIRGRQIFNLRLPAPGPLLLPTFFFAVIAAAAAFMSLPISRSIWEIVSILQVAEFPWRMLGVANLGLAFLAGGVVLWLPTKLRWPLTLVCLVVQIAAVAPYLYPVIGFTRYDQVTIADQINYERRSQSIGTTTLGEYLPQTITTPPTTSPLVKAFQVNPSPERLDRSSLPDGATATLLEQTAVTHRYRLDSPTAFTLRFFQFDYPGWQARLDGQPALIQPEAESGLILINIPPGPHELVIYFGETPGRVIALLLTGLTVVGLIGAGLVRRLRVNTLAGTSKQGSIVNDPGSGKHEDTNKISPAPLLLRSPAFFAVSFLIIAAALWLKPLLRPVFTLNSPPDRALPAQYQTQINFAQGIQLIGYDMDKRVVSGGERVQIVLYWQTDAAPLEVNLQPFVHLDRLDTWTTVAGATNYTPGDATTESVLPTFHWDNARYVRDEYDLTVPPDTPPLAYALRVGLIDPDQGGRLLPLANGSGDTAQLTVINVTAPAGGTSPLAESLEASFQAGSAAIHLTGFELDPPAQDRLDFRLAWRTDQAPPADYTVFAQLLDLENNLAASYDRPPLDGAYPTSTWLSGQTIIDPRYIPLQNVPPGEYRLIVGLYNPASQQRLLTVSGADFVELTRVTVGD